MKPLSALFSLAILVFGLPSYAGEFDEGAPTYDQRQLPTRTEADIQREIQEQMAVACRGNLCTVIGADSTGNSWTVSFNAGYGSQPSGGSGNNIYLGNNNSSNGFYTGITVTYKNYRCESTLKVTPAVYQFINTYMYNMINSDYTVKRNFSPTEQTVILFYTTMLNKVESCRQNL